jgi:hypothetical protein
MSNENPTPTPLLDIIDDPRGMPGGIPDEHSSPGHAGAYFVRRIQQIRWELFGLEGDLDAIEGMTSATGVLLPQVIDLLGVIARAEAACADLNIGADDERADAQWGELLFKQNPWEPGQRRHDLDEIEDPPEDDDDEAGDDR